MESGGSKRSRFAPNTMVSEPGKGIGREREKDRDRERKRKRMKDREKERKRKKERERERKSELVEAHNVNERHRGRDILTKTATKLLHT